MTEQSETPEPGITDELLPEDLQPSEDNPLAEPLDPDAEGSKDAEELGMTDTQDDTTGDYRSDGELGEAGAPVEDDEDDDPER